MGLATSRLLVKNILYSCAEQLISQLLPGLVRLTGKNNYLTIITGGEVLFECFSTFSFLDKAQSWPQLI